MIRVLFFYSKYFFWTNWLSVACAASCLVNAYRKETAYFHLVFEDENVNGVLKLKRLAAFHVDSVNVYADQFHFKIHFKIHHFRRG